MPPGQGPFPGPSGPPPSSPPLPEPPSNPLASPEPPPRSSTPPLARLAAAVSTHPDWGAALALLLLPVVFLWPALFGGKVLLPADALYGYLPWKAYAAQQGVAVPYNDLIADMVLQNYGWKELFKQSVSVGEVPLWNPYVFTGVPLLAAGQAGVLYPLAAPFFLLLPVAAAYGWYTALHLFLAGLFTYWFARLLGLTRPAALAGGVAFAFSGVLLVSLQWPQVVGAAAWLPLLFCCVEGVYRNTAGAAPSRFSSTAWFLFGSLAAGLQLLSGHLEVSLYGFAALSAYALLRAVQAAGHRGLVAALAPVALAAGATALGAGLAAVQLLPFVEYARDSARSATVGGADIPGLALPLRQLLAFAVPDVFGNPAHHTYFDLFTWRETPFASASVAGEAKSYPFWGTRDYVEGTAYMGVLTLVLGLVAALLRRDATTRFFAAFAALSLLLAFGTPLYSVLFAFPGFDALRSPFRWVFPYSFCLTVLAALGLDALRRRPATARRVGAAALGLGLAALAAIAAARALDGPSLALAAGWLEASAALRAAFPSPEALVSYQALNVARFALLLAAGGIAVLLLARGRRGWALAAAGVLALDLFGFGRAFVTFSDPALLRFIPPSLQWLQEQQAEHGPFRVAAFGPERVLPPNSAMLAGLEDVRGYDSLLPRQYADLWRLQEEPAGLRYNQINTLLDPGSLASPLFDLLGARYVLSAAPLRAAGLNEVYRGEVHIYENRDVLPRAFAVPSAVRVETIDDARRLVGSPAFDPRRTVVLDGPEGGTVPQEPDFGLTPAAVVARSPNRVEVAVSLPASGYLVLAEAYAPGWEAAIDGGPRRPVLRANAAFRSVPLTAGDHRVVFTYAPASFRFGLYVTFLSGIAWLLLAATWAWRRYYREAAGGTPSLARRIVKNSATPLAAQVVVRTVDLGFAIVMLRLLGPAGYGTFAFAVALTGYFAVVSDFGLGTLITREVAREPASAGRYLANAVLIRLGLVGASGPLLLGLALLYHRSFGLPQEGVAVALLLLAAQAPAAVASAFSALFSAREQMEYQAGVAVATNLARALLGLAALAAGTGAVGLAAVALVVTSLNALAFGLLTARTFGMPRIQPDLAFARTMLAAAFPLMLNNLLNTIFFRVDMLLIQPLLGTAAVGWYSTAYKFIDAALMAPSIFTLALFPALSRYARSSPEALLRTYTRGLKALLLVAFPVAIGGTVVADQLVLLLFGEDYAPAIGALRVLIWFVPFSYVNGLTQYVLIAVDRQRYITVAFVFATAFNVAGNLVAIPLFGIQGAAAVTVLSEIALLVPFLSGAGRYVGAAPFLSIAVRPALAAALMGLVLLPLGHLSVFLLVPLGAAVYLGALVALRAFDAEDRAILRSILAR